MDGYSVTEAASVLGVPTERVWELLARGVLSGTPEGETGMRVFLQPRPAPAPPQARPNGNDGDEPHRELSPFRELLTEFRSLTERYGQALLALGEARGEVAALRSRVDMLEARMDLRLPPGGATGPATGFRQPMPWSAPRGEPPSPAAQAAAVSEAVADPEPAAPAETEADAGAEPRTVRRDSPRRATESFAEALARAQDPSPPELPGGPEAAAALTALRGATAEDAPEAALPRELPPADEVPVADEALGIQAPPDPAAQAAPEAVTAAEEPAMTQEPQEPPPAPDEPASVGPDAPASMDTGTARDEATPEAASAADSAAEESDGGPAWHDDRYTAEIGEPDWWEAEAFPAAPAQSEPETKEAAADEAADGGEPAEGFAEPAATAEPAEAESVEAPSTAPEPRPQAATGPPSHASGGLTRLRRAPPPPDEETVLWFGHSPASPEPGPEGIGAREDAEAEGGAGEMEIAPTGRSGEATPAQGPRPLDDALTALEELSRATPPRAGAGQPERSAVDDRSDAGWTDQAIERARRQPATPAGRAYRRLRRILPG